MTASSTRPRADTRTRPVRVVAAGRAARGGLRLPLGPADREVLWLYVCTRAGLWVTAYCARWLFTTDDGSHKAGSVLSSWQQWDWAFYQRIAQHGYFPGATGPWTAGWDNREAFLPGFPLVLRAVHTVVRNWTAAGLLISFTAGAVAVLALARIARLEPGEPGEPGGSAPGRRAALVFLLSPCAVFLAAGYTEALFLALALPAWLAARRGQWARAGVLTCLASAVRVNGLFLAVAVALHFLTTSRRWRSAPWLALPAAAPLLYSWYLHAHTGDWMAWKHAENRGWYRDFHSPWSAWHHTWTAAFGHTQNTGYALEFQAELLAMVLGLALLVLLLARRRLPEAAYLALTLWALGTSYWYMSVPRSTLLWWPLFTTTLRARHPHLRTLSLCLTAPLTTVVALTFLSGHWAG